MNMLYYRRRKDFLISMLKKLGLVSVIMSCLQVVHDYNFFKLRMYCDHTVVIILKNFFSRFIKLNNRR